MNAKTNHWKILDLIFFLEFKFPKKVWRWSIQEIMKITQKSTQNPREIKNFAVGLNHEPFRVVELQNLHNDYHVAPEKTEIKKNMLFDY